MRLEDVETFGKYLGGSPTNVAVAAARHGRNAAVITRTGDDPFGRFVHQALRGYGVDDRFVTPVAGLPTPLAFCEIFPPDDFPLYFYRYPKAPDLEIRADELDFDAIRAAKVFWATVTGLSRRAEPLGHARRAGGASGGRAPCSTWTTGRCSGPPPDEARHWVDKALGHVTVAVGNLEECEVAVGESDPHRAAEALLDRGVRARRRQAGPQGRAGRRRRRAWSRCRRCRWRWSTGSARATPSAARCATACWPAGRRPHHRFANAAGAIVASQIACSDGDAGHRRGRGRCLSETTELEGLTVDASRSDSKR